MDTRATVREFVTGNFLVADGDGLTDDASLLELGIVDSTGVLEIIAFLETTFGLTVEDDEIVPENLDSIDRIVGYVGRKRPAGGSGPPPRAGGLWLWVVCLVTGCGPVAHAPAETAVSRRLPPAAWSALASRRVFFGHQSVGENVVEGISELARGDPALGIRVVEGAGALRGGEGAFGHARIGRNGEPGLKSDEFARLVESAAGESLDIAFHKYCYADIGADTDVEAVFEHYRRTMARLRAERPGVVFVHVTVPLTRVQSGPRALVKRLLGRTPGRFDSNRARERFNDLMRRTYAGTEPLFDLAAAESTHPDGRPETFRFGGQSLRALVPSYTDDGSHLNALGRRRVAGELLVVLARIASGGGAP
jgi:acyl carrier protein